MTYKNLSTWYTELRQYRPAIPTLLGANKIDENMEVGHQFELNCKTKCQVNVSCVSSVFFVLVNCQVFCIGHLANCQVFLYWSIVIRWRRRVSPLPARTTSPSTMCLRRMAPMWSRCSGDKSLDVYTFSLAFLQTNLQKKCFHFFAFHLDFCFVLY